MMNIRSNLRTRILFLTGTVITLLMLAISFVLLFKWRELIIQNQSENAVSISRTFAVTVIDAMIFEETSLYRNENILESYVENFMSKIRRVKYVVVYDKHGATVVHVTGNQALDSSLTAIPNAGLDSMRRVRIYEHSALGWTLEVHEPLIFSGKVWGSATIGFDAQSIRDEIRSVFFLLLIGTVVIILAVLVILYLLIHRMTASIERLVHAIDSLDFRSDRRVDLPQQQDEIGFFYQHFSLLQERLELSKRDLEKAQKQVYQAEKLASIGRLASGVAHQVNNPLNGIKSCLYAMQQNRDDAARVREYLDLINDGITDIETVVKKLLGFARQQSTSESVIDINEAIQKVISLFELRLKEKNIVIHTDLAQGLGPVRIDYHLFQEVVMNLVLNSYDAIAQNGTITIATRPAESNTVCMEITDSGTGITPENIKKIFDPFFTTKDVGTGTGLGLSVCLGIIESHGGRIDVQSTPGVQTVFTITVPVDHEYETAPH